MSASPPKRKFAVLSSDVNETYSFFLPIAARAWKRLGWTPLCILVGDLDTWEKKPRARFSLSHTDPEDVAIFVRPAEGYRVGTTAQVVRLLAAAIPKVKKSDYLLTSDVDMIPLDKDHFLKQDWSMDFNVIGADAYADLTKGYSPPKFPMCYLGARADAWKDVMGIKSEDVNLEVKTALSGRPDQWDNDEMYFASRLHRHRFFNGKYEKVSDGRYKRGTCDLLLRGWPYGRALRRIDREVWGFNGESGMIDCHCQRPGFKNPKILRSILSKYFPEETPWFDKYIAGYPQVAEKTSG